MSQLDLYLTLKIKYEFSVNLATQSQFNKNTSFIEYFKMIRDHLTKHRYEKYQFLTPYINWEFNPNASTIQVNGLKISSNQLKTIQKDLLIIFGHPVFDLYKNEDYQTYLSTEDKEFILDSKNKFCNYLRGTSKDLVHKTIKNPFLYKHELTICLIDEIRPYLIIDRVLKRKIITLKFDTRELMLSLDQWIESNNERLSQFIEDQQLKTLMEAQKEAYKQLSPFDPNEYMQFLKQKENRNNKKSRKTTYKSLRSSQLAPQHLGFPSSNSDLSTCLIDSSTPNLSDSQPDQSILFQNHEIEQVITPHENEDMEAFSSGSSADKIIASPNLSPEFREQKIDSTSELKENETIDVLENTIAKALSEQSDINVFFLTRDQYPDWIESLLHNKHPVFAKIVRDFQRFIIDSQLYEYFNQTGNKGAFVIQSPVTKVSFAETFHIPHKNVDEKSWPSWRHALKDLLIKAQIIYG